MEELLEPYLKSTYNWEYVKVDYYNVDGANCEVVFYTDVEEYYKETRNVNIWDLTAFTLHEQR